LDQPKKPADISNLKARLGIKKPGAAPAAPGGIPGGAAPNPYPGAASTQSTGSLPTTAARQSGSLPTAPGMQAPGMQPQPATRQAPRHDPYSSFRPPAGTTFDLGPDDGNPIENVRQKGGKGGLVVGAILLVVGLGVGGGFGGAAIGRKAFNNANMAAKIIKAELDEMSKTISLIGDELKTSAQRSSAKGDTFAFDYKLVEALEQVDLSKRPTTTRIFRADYFRLENNLLDRLMNYYYDATALYREAEDHVRRSKDCQFTEGGQLRHRFRQRWIIDDRQPGRGRNARLQRRRRRSRVQSRRHRRIPDSREFKLFLGATKRRREDRSQKRHPYQAH